jgi:hypothetical protein
MSPVFVTAKKVCEISSNWPIFGDFGCPAGKWGNLRSVFTQEEE